MISSLIHNLYFNRILLYKITGVILFREEDPEVSPLSSSLLQTLFSLSISLCVCVPPSVFFLNSNIYFFLLFLKTKEIMGEVERKRDLLIAQLQLQIGVSLFPSLEVNFFFRVTFFLKMLSGHHGRSHQISAKEVIHLLAPASNV